MDSDELRAALELKLSAGIGDIRLRRLLRGSPSSTAALDTYRRGRMDRAEPERYAPHAAGWKRGSRIQDRIERAVAFIESSGIRVVLEPEPDYPESLRHLHDPPPILFAAGDFTLVREVSVAVVGSRHHTAYGAAAAARLAEGLAGAGIVIVSGLARGIDKVAHEAALRAGGWTIAVLGCGIDLAYPREHRQLQEQIAREGLVLSEFVPGEPPAPHNFPKRNRILAALSRALVVVEAAEGSGALITADHAMDLGRDVFAVPGPMGRETAEGTHRLVRDGAFLAACPEDVLAVVQATGRAVRSTVPEPLAPPAEPRRAAVWSALAAGAMHIDDLARTSGVATRESVVLLLEMEIEGLVRQLPGMRFARAAAAPPAGR